MVTLLEFPRGKFILYAVKTGFVIPIRVAWSLF